MDRRHVLAVLLMLTFATADSVGGQVKTNVRPVPGAPTVSVERIKIKGAALEGNLEGNAAERDVLVALPPSDTREAARRYPVVYGLHGYWIGAEQWAQQLHVQQTAAGTHAGNFEAFVARDVVQYVDAHYRTIAGRDSRGLVGHSIGGYGASRIGMKHADVSGAILNSWCIPHTFEVYPGTHTSQVAVRFQDHVLPFFSRTLSFEAPPGR